MQSDRSNNLETLKELLRANDPGFWSELSNQSAAASSFSELMSLSRMRMRASAVGLTSHSNQDHPPLSIAIVGGSTLYPMSELVEHLVSVRTGPAKVITGEFNNYRSEMLDGSEAIDEFKPNVIVIVPEDKTCTYSGALTDERSRVDEEIDRFCSDLLAVCSAAHNRHGAEIVLCNFVPSPYFDLGQYGNKSHSSEWNFKRSVNLALAERAPNYVLICDLEFLAYRCGGLSARDDRSWLESKQPLSPAMQMATANEISHIIAAIKGASKKVLVLDLDNTLWGGVIGDDGIEGIEIGDTSPRGEAFKAFQSYILSLIDRGVLLGVCSKNDYENAIEPFRVHPEMVLREEHLVSFKANWEPKAANIVEMADELSLGLDSFVFVDDNPAEIEIVRQFAPEVTTILLSDDPSTYVRQLKESRLFERSAITREDSDRTQQYRQEVDRRQLERTAVDMDSYLLSLEMVRTVREFDRLDLPRIAQLINKSNQFNLTTKRRSEAEIAALMMDPEYVGFTVRLADRLGDHGLISIVICRRVSNDVLEIDTWLMSCRVLKRQVEHEVLNEIVSRAQAEGCSVVRGRYIQTQKNSMVRDLLPSLGFQMVGSSVEELEFELSLSEFKQLPTFIGKGDDFTHVKQTGRNISATAVSI